MLNLCLKLLINEVCELYPIIEEIFEIVENLLEISKFAAFSSLIDLILS